jgi:hypothetical protein
MRRMKLWLRKEFFEPYDESNIVYVINIKTVHVLTCGRMLFFNLNTLNAVYAPVPDPAPLFM